MKTIRNVGFGTFNGVGDHNRMGKATQDAITAGYRLFDLASSYGNQVQVGAALKAAISSGEVARGDVCVCSKLWMNDAAPEDVEAACRKTLAETGLDYLDCFLMHWPVQWTKASDAVCTESTGEFKFENVHSGDAASILATWRAMEALVEKGLVRSLGVSNFNEAQLERLLAAATVKPAVNQVELHPYLAQPSLVQFCQDEDVHVIAYSPLGQPRAAGGPNVLEDPAVVKLAAELGRTPAQVVLRWGVQKGWTVIPKTWTPARLAENLDVAEWRLPSKAMNVLDGLNRAHRFCRPPWYSFEGEAADVALPKEQPEVIKGTIDEATGEYHNAFYRAGKLLHTDITIKRGILSNLAARGKALLPEACHDAPNFLVTDEICDRAFGDKVLQGLRASGLSVEKVVVPADEIDEAGVSGTEAYKTTGILSRCYDEILGKGINKHSCIVSLGGGVVNNLCGMIAGTLYRGISLVHFTTTFMGMADAAIDFKQAVNHPLGKNLIGTYYPASRVVIDTEVLASLAPRHTLNGIAEALKHGLAQSPELTEAIVGPFRERGVAAALGDSEVLDKIIKGCIEYKVPTLIYYHGSDLNEMAPQYGHAVGHAVEHTSYHDGVSQALLHGEAVAIGMCVSADIACIMGLCDEGVVDATYDACETVGLPVYVPASMNLETVKKKLTYDKHFVKKPTMGLPVKLGQLHSVPTGLTGSRGPAVTFMTEVEADVLDLALKRNAARRDARVPVVRASQASSSSVSSSSPSMPSSSSSSSAAATSEKGGQQKAVVAVGSSEDEFKAEDAKALLSAANAGGSSSSSSAFASKKFPSDTNLAGFASTFVLNGVRLEEAFFVKYVKTGEDMRSINQFRADYAQFRSGNAKGASGEVSALAAGIGSEPSKALRQLPGGFLCGCCS